VKLQENITDYGTDKHGVEWVRFFLRGTATWITQRDENSVWWFSDNTGLDLIRAIEEASVFSKSVYSIKEIDTELYNDLSAWMDGSTDKTLIGKEYLKVENKMRKNLNETEKREYRLYDKYQGGEDVIATFKTLENAISRLVDYVKGTEASDYDKYQSVFVEGPDPWNHKYLIGYVICDKGLFNDDLFKHIEDSGNMYITVYTDGTWKANELALKTLKDPSENTLEEKKEENMINRIKESTSWFVTYVGESTNWDNKGVKYIPMVGSDSIREFDGRLSLNSALVKACEYGKVLNSRTKGGYVKGLVIGRSGSQRSFDETNLVIYTLSGSKTGKHIDDYVESGEFNMDKKPMREAGQYTFDGRVEDEFYEGNSRFKTIYNYISKRFGPEFGKSQSQVNVKAFSEGIYDFIIETKGENRSGDQEELIEYIDNLFEDFDDFLDSDIMDAVKDYICSEVENVGIRVDDDEYLENMYADSGLDLEYNENESGFVDSEDEDTYLLEKGLTKKDLEDWLSHQENLNIETIIEDRYQDASGRGVILLGCYPIGEMEEQLPDELLRFFRNPENTDLLIDLDRRFKYRVDNGMVYIDLSQKTINYVVYWRQIAKKFYEDMGIDSTK